MKYMKPLSLSILIGATTIANTSYADNNRYIAKQLTANLIASGYDKEVLSVEPTKVENIYIVNMDGAPSFFSDSTGKYVFQGQIMELGKGVPIDIMTKHFAKRAASELAKIPKSELITYPATNDTKAVVYVFTDVDCPYCIKLHKEIEETNKLGVEIRYLAWPRAEQSLAKTKSIWCSQDKTIAFDKVILGGSIEDKTCGDVVERHIALGNSLGVNGTPSIFTESGQLIGGYLPSAQLVKSAVANQ